MKTNKNLFIISGLVLLIFLGCSRPIFSMQKLDDDIFREVQDLTQEIIKVHPLKETIFIGLGRSPTPIMAYLHNLPQSEIYNLPLSSFRSFDLLTMRVVILHKLMEHFDHFLPKKENLKNKRIVIIDFTVTGESLISGYKAIDYYYNTHGKNKSPSSEISMVALVSGISFDLVELRERLLMKMNGRGKVWILGRKHINLGLKILNQGFDELSEYGAFPFYQSPSLEIKKRSSAKYLDLRMSFLKFSNDFFENSSDFKCFQQKMENNINILKINNEEWSFIGWIRKKIF